MLPSFQVEAFLTGTMDDNFVAAVSNAPQNAIIVHYNHRKNLLTKLAGKRGGTGNLATEIMAVDGQQLRTILDSFAFDTIARGSWRRLSASEWAALRSAIIASVPDLQRVIEVLEEIQQRQPFLSSNAAVIYDTLHSVIEIFNPSGIQALNKKLDMWREQFTNASLLDAPSTPGQLIASLGNGIREAPVVASFDAIDWQIEAVMRQRTDEVDNVLFDARTGLPGTEPDPNQPLDETTFRFQFRDTERPGRWLRIWMGHQKGQRRTDILGSDLIYDNQTNRSIVFVQHKRLAPSDKWSLPLSDSQLLLLLETCRAQGTCHNYIAESDFYPPSSEMRLYDCPVFYKLLNHDAQIKSGTRSSAGIYIQACRARQLMVEHHGTISRLEARDHGMFLETFSEQFRRAQLGSRASAYDILKQRILGYITGTLQTDRIVTVAEQIGG